MAPLTRNGASSNPARFGVRREHLTDTPNEIGQSRLHLKRLQVLESAV